MKILIRTLTDFKFKLEPTLKKAISALTRNNFRKKVDEESKMYARMYLTEVKLNIMTNKFRFKLKPDTIRKKGSDLPWVDTKQLYNAIVQEGDKVVVKDSVRQAKSKMTNREIAMILEYGRKDKSIPPRPVFRLTMKEFRERVKTDLKKKCKRNKKR